MNQFPDPNIPLQYGSIFSLLIQQSLNQQYGHSSPFSPMQPYSGLGSFFGNSSPALGSVLQYLASTPPSPSYTQFSGLGSLLGNSPMGYGGASSLPFIQQNANSSPLDPSPLSAPTRPLTNSMAVSTSPTRSRTPGKITETSVKFLHQRLSRLTAQRGNQSVSPTIGKVIPKLENLSLGQAKQFDGTVVFFDMVGSTRMQIDYIHEPQIPFQVTSLFCSVIMTMVQFQAGIYEKNTGDGVLAYFGVGSKDATKGSVAALKAILLTKESLSSVVNPFLASKGYPTIQMTVGMETGTFLIGKVGLSEKYELSGNSIVAQGAVPNIASKITGIATSGQILLGDGTYHHLPAEFSKDCLVEPLHKTLHTLLGKDYYHYKYEGLLQYDK